jgi:hypothetical protein
LSEIGKLIGTLLAIFSILGAVTFYVALSNGLYAVTQGDPDAAQEVAEVLRDETVNTIKGEVVLAVLGILGSIVAIFVGAIKALRIF